MTKRRIHSPKLKAKIALEAARNDRTINEIAATYQVHPSQVSQWKKALLSEASILFERGSRPRNADDMEQEVAALHQKIGQLTVESDWLKKKLKL